MRTAWMLGAVVAAATFGWACGNAQPCVDCPPMEGAYQVTWNNPINTTNCAVGVTGPKPGALNVLREGSAVHTTVGGITLGGTLYDTYDFTLHGSNETVDYAMKGRLVPVSASSDAGVRLQGTLTTANSQGVSKDAPCSLVEEFQAIKL